MGLPPVPPAPTAASGSATAPAESKKVAAKAAPKAIDIDEFAGLVSPALAALMDI